jgi:hypothetical protein
MKKIFIIGFIGFIWLVFLTIGLVYPNLYGELFKSVRFGATSFPTSVDSLTNPNPTDSVATVSHSSQHSNANDAIEALEAKLRINGDTVGGFLLGSDGTHSGWTAYATGTSAYFTNYLATGSTTLQHFTFRNATGTQATTTNFFSTTASSSAFSSTSLAGGTITGFGLANCNSGSFLQFTTNQFGCATPATGGTTVYSTTTAQNLATTTILSADIPSSNNLEITVSMPALVGTASTSAQVWMIFNGDLTSTYVYDGITDTTSFQAQDNKLRLVLASGDARYEARFAKVEMHNTSAIQKFGYYDSSVIDKRAASRAILAGGGQRAAGFMWSNTSSRVTQIDIWTSIQGVTIGAGTVITVLGY